MLTWFTKVALVLTESEVKDLLSEKGAEQEGKSLEQVGKLVQDYGAAGFNIGRTLLVYGAGIAVLACAIGLILHGRNVQKRQEAKEGILWTVAGIILGFAALSVVLLAQSIGTSLFGN